MPGKESIMADGDHRQSDRRACEGKVLVTQLGGGPDIEGSLIDIGDGGARIMVDRRLYCGDRVRVVFLDKIVGGTKPGRPMVGQVRHSRETPGSHIVGIAFEGDPRVEKEQRPSRRKMGLRSWFRRFSQK